MGFEDIYQLGKIVPYKFNLPSAEKKLKFIYYPYTASEILSTSLVIFAFSFSLGAILGMFSSFLLSTVMFLGTIIAISLYIYPVNVYYTTKIMEYREEMLRSVLHVSTFIETGNSLESAFLQTQDNLTGILGKQFQHINHMLHRRVKNTLGDAINIYIKTWNEINPQYVKAIRLLQLAALSGQEDKERLISETIETLMLNYTVLGKRSAENLSKKTGMLLAGGLLVPIMSLLGLPILAVFMPQLINEAMIAFIYIVLFPVLVFITALSFASERIQVDTIRLEDSVEYKPFPSYFKYISMGIALIGLIPTLLIVRSSTDAGLDINLSMMFLAWLGSGTIALGIYIYSYFYVKRYKKLWKKIDEVESDLPFMLQSFSTYFTLNTPFEKVIDGVIDDYNNLGFRKHPVVKVFKELKNLLYSTKLSIKHIVEHNLKTLVPSVKVRSVLSQVVMYESVSQEGAAKASRMIRGQVISTYKLDDYIRTLLSETIGLIKVGISMLAPLLGSVAVVMTFAILKSTVFITEELEKISALFGGQKIEMNLIDITQTISPIYITAVISIYILLMIVVLSIFQTHIKTGMDHFQIMKDLRDNILSFVMYTIMMFGGFFFVNEVLFKALMG
jgi:hypothetical protein